MSGGGQIVAYFGQNLKFTPPGRFVLAQIVAYFGQNLKFTPPGRFVLAQISIRTLEIASWKPRSVC